MGHPWVFDDLVDGTISNNPFKLIVSRVRVPGLKVTIDGYGLPICIKLRRSRQSRNLKNDTTAACSDPTDDQRS